MKPKLTIRSIYVVVFLVSAGAASAVSLGPVSGAAVVKRSLELSAPLQFDDVAQAGGSACINAEVLHAGCGRQSSRRYVLFAGAPRQQLIRPGVASSLAVGNASPRAVAAWSPEAAPPQVVRRPSVARIKPVVARADRPAPERRAFSLASMGQIRQPGKLQLAVWEPLPERSPWLGAPKAQPQDLLRTADRLHGLEGEVGALRSLAASHQTEISFARESLHAAQTQRYTNLAMAVGLALLAGAAAALFWHRSRRAEMLAPYASWSPAVEPHGDAVVQEEPEEASPEVAAPVAEPVTAKVQQAASAQPAVLPEHEPLESQSGAPFEFTLSPVHQAPTPVQADHSTPGMKVDTLHGAQQQSEFFASLGQFDEAVAVLSGYLAETRERPVLAFLELFQIYHALGRRAGYEELQSTFRQTFGMDVLSFGAFSNERRELESYPVVVSRIAASWPSQSSLDLIEDLLFKRPAAPREMLSLDAYRELIWLYSLGQEIVYSTGMAAGLQLMGGTNLPNDHFILPWAVDSEKGPPELSLDRLTDIDVAPGMGGFGLDIDLSAGSGESVQQSRADGRVEPAGAARQVPYGAAPPDVPNAFDAATEFQRRQ